MPNQDRDPQAANDSLDLLAVNKETLQDLDGDSSFGANVKGGGPGVDLVGGVGYTPPTLNPTIRATGTSVIMPR